MKKDENAVLLELAEQLFNLKDQKSTINKELKSINKQIDSVENHMAELMAEQGIEQFRSAYGSCTMNVALYPTIQDFNNFMDWVMRTESYEFLYRRVNEKSFREFVDNAGEYPPGLDAYPKTKINTRKKS